MDVQQLRNFLVLCNTLNFRKAAEQVNIVQPALSKQIQLLESELGAVLFDRSNRSVQLTEAGLYFRDEADRILHDLHRTISHTAQIHRGEAGEIRITHSTSAMNTIVPTFLAKVKKKWPRLKTIAQETSNFQQLELLLARKTDLGVAPNVMLPEQVRSKTLYEEDFVLILPRHHHLTKENFKSMSALHNETFILPERSTGIGYLEMILQICQDAGFKPQVAHESANAMGVLRLVEAGLGVSIEPISVVRGVDLDITLIPLTTIPQKVRMTLFWLREREKELERFIEIFE